MSMYHHKPSEWMNAELKRFKSQLPIECQGKSRALEKSICLVRNSLIKLSKNKFHLVVTTLTSYLKDNPTMNMMSGEHQQLAWESNIIVLETIKQCFENSLEESSALSDDVVKKQLLSTLCPLIFFADASVSTLKTISTLAGKIIYYISQHHFSSVFERINRRILTVENNDDNNVGDDLELIQYLHVPVEGLIVLFKECSIHFKAMKRNSQQVMIRGLFKSVWNWIETYPEQFTYLYKETNVQLSELSEKLFTLIDQFAEATKKRQLAWPLQIMLLLLSPESIQEASGSGELTKGSNFIKRQFLENLKKALVSNRSSSEYALLACVHLCKASTFISREDNIACFLVSQVMNELKTMLFNAEKPYSSATGLPTSQLMVDLLVSSLRLNYRNNQHFEICFQPDAAVVFQHALVKGIYTVVTEDALHWWPKATVLYNRSAQIRNMFEQCIRRMTSYEPNLPKSSNSHRSSLGRVSSMGVKYKKDEAHSSFEKDAKLLLWLVKLFHADPQLALNNPDKNAAEIQASSMQILNGLVIVMMFTKIPQVSAEVSETLLSLHSSENIELWNPEAPMATFWEISSQIVYNVADQLMCEQMPNQLKDMRWLQKVLKCRIQFVEKNKMNALIGTHHSICAEALHKLETMFLKSLWSSSTDIVLLSMKCFGLLFEEAMLLSFDRPSPIHPLPLTTVYYKFANEVKQTGRTALHKCILSILRDINVQTPGNLKAWEITYARWQRMTVSLTNYPREELVLPEGSVAKQKNVSSPVAVFTDDVLETYLSEWRKMTSYLCSLGGICVNDSEESINKTVRHFSHSKNLEDSPVNRFISEMLTLLVCENENTSLQIRSAVKEALGSDLSFQLYPAFFALCKATTVCFFDENNQVKVCLPHTVYAEHLIYVIKNILEKKYYHKPNLLLSMPVEDIVGAILRYIRSLTVSVQSLVIKSKMCQLVECLMARRGDLSFRQEMRFRNRLVDYLTDWVLYANDESQSTTQEVLAISCTLDEAAMKAVAVLLKCLPLQPENFEQDIADVKSNLFLKHFTLFMNILNKCYDMTDDNNTRKGNLAPHFVKLRAHTVQAMSNMLSANIDSGLMHAIGLGYHEDPQTRSTFLEVLTDILKQGTEFENLAETVLEDRFERMVQLVTDNNQSEDIPMIMALCNSVISDDMDEVAKVLVNIFNSRGSLDILLLNLFKDEVEKSESQQTLFRGNTIASKAMAYAFKIYGGNYIHLLLSPLVNEMIEETGKSYEVDSARLEEGESIGDNTQNVIELANNFMDKVRDQQDQFPMQLRSLCYCLNKAVHTRFSATAYDAVSSAVFLRFINPAIVSPQSFGIVCEAVPKTVRRGLMILSKILQNLANHLYFSKEAHMEVFNGFLENNFHRLHSFFREISMKPDTVSAETDSLASFAIDNNVASLHKLLWTAQEKMGKYLAMVRDAGPTTRDHYEKLVTLLAHLGPPENQQTQQIVGDRKESYALRLEDFLASHAGHNQDELELIKSSQVFYGDGKSRAGRNVFYYIARRYLNDTISDEVFLYHILLTLQSVYNQPWELVVDFSHTSPVNRFKIETLIKASALLPDVQLKNLQVVYIYNVNNSLKQYVELHERTMRPLKNHPKVVIIDKLTKLYEFIAPESLKLPTSTTSLENDVQVFSVLKITMKGTIYLKVNPTSVQLQPVDKVKLLGYSVYVNDVFYASEIKRASSNEDMLRLEFSTRSAHVHFYTTEAETIASKINHLHSRWKLSQPNQKTKMATKKLRPKDVPGTLLNMSLINMGNRDPCLRLAAYNLLCSLTATFNLQVNERLLEAKGICIPANCTLFIKSISEQLAEREPNLTLEFLEECICGFSKSDDESRNLCLTYMAPWLPNLARFCSKDAEDKDKMVEIINKLIQLTISNRQNYPFIQASVWGNIGKIPDLLDVVIELFIKTSSAGGYSSQKAEVMADTTVTLASANVPLVSKKIFDRFHMVIERTMISPTESLEQHLMWDDIAILARYLLMMSFNNSLDVSIHLGDIFHVVTLLMATGPLTLRASIHGLVINSLQSILTCSDMKISSKTQLLICTRLDDLSLQKFYLLFGILNVKSAPVNAFLPHVKSQQRAFHHVKAKEKEETKLSLTALQSITEVLYDVLESCLIDLKDHALLIRWQKLCASHCYGYNAAVQCRCIVVMGSIKKEISDKDVILMLEVLGKACGYYMDHMLIDAVIICLSKYQLLLEKDSIFHKVFFWVAVGILQFGEQSLYPSALSLLEHNLNACHAFNMYQGKGIVFEMMEHRNDCTYIWIFKQLDHLVGLSFTTDFHFALIALLVKGIRHPSSKTKSSSLRIVNTMLSICSKKSNSGGKDKLDVNGDTLPYLAALMPSSEDIRLSLYNEHPVYSTTLTMKRRKSKIYADVRKNVNVIVTVSPTHKCTSVSLAKQRYEFESGRYNSLLNPELLYTVDRQVLLIVLLATLVEYTMDDFEAKTLFEVLAEASILYSEVFPICYSILNRKLCNVLSHSDDAETLTAAQTIVDSMSTSDMLKPPIQLQKLTSIGFHGLHSFPGPFLEPTNRQVAPQMFTRYINAVVDRHACLTSEARSSSDEITPTSKDDVTLNSSSHSLNAIAEQPTATPNGGFNPFKRVGSYSPARRQRKADINSEPVKETRR